MTEQPDPEVPATDDAVAEPASEASTTGNPAVDEVLRSLDRLDELPLSEHPGAFEQAHESLRAALSQARERPTDGAGSPTEG